MDYIEELEELCETLVNHISEVNKKVRANNGKINSGDVEYIDWLTHALKSIKTTIAMEDYSDDDGYSERGYSRRGGSYNDGGSYARGRGRNARRDSMGRYSREGGSYRRGGGYSRDDGKEEMSEHLRRMMEEAGTEKEREMIRRWLSDMERA